MSGIFASFKPRHEYLVCVDSDGCVMDTMTCKHVLSFGPCLVNEWGLGRWREEILKGWNEVNLYRVTRGINRFKGLALALTEINEKHTRIEGIESYLRWCETTHAHSEESLIKAIGTADGGEEGECLRKALAWSLKVNESIDAIPYDVMMPFQGAKEGLKRAHSLADVVVVSGARHKTVCDEWQRHGLLKYTDLVLAQDVGSKAYCISEMLRLGYDRSRTLMIGDAMGDLDAAEINGVHFFPILTGKEAKSWREVCDVGLLKLLDGTYHGEYQRDKKTEFIKNFK